ncbi:MAG: hypothetical protein M3O77_07850 [Chloroflexota bacterium]|nr:hypothetical protein [Chloroflexota bacterium]
MGGGNSGGSSHGNAAPPQTLQQLQSEGAAGSNAANLAQATAPGGGFGQAASGNGSGGANGAVADQPSGSGALSGVGSALGGDSGGGGLGIVLPLILAGTLLAGIAYWLIRRGRAGAIS